MFLKLGLVAFSALHIKKNNSKYALASSEIASWMSNWDSRDTEKACFDRDLLFIPHGACDVSPNPDPSLNLLGRKQAMSVGRFMTSEGIDMDISQVYVSNTKRTLETWEAIREQFIKNSQSNFARIGVCKVDDLAEGTPSDDCFVDEAHNNYAYHLTPRRNLLKTFHKYIHRQNRSSKSDTVELFICHPNLIRYFVMKALQFPRTWSQLYINPCTLTHIKIDAKGHVKLVSFNEGGFFKREQNNLF